MTDLKVSIQGKLGELTKKLADNPTDAVAGDQLKAQLENATYVEDLFTSREVLENAREASTEYEKTKEPDSADSETEAMSPKKGESTKRGMRGFTKRGGKKAGAEAVKV